jgi:hypothetical protein
MAAMGTLQVNISRRQQHIAQIAACHCAFAKSLRLHLTVAFSCSETIAQEIMDEAFLLLYEELEAGSTILYPAVWLYATSDRLMRERRSPCTRLAARVLRRLGWYEVQRRWRARLPRRGLPSRGDRGQAGS